MSYDDGKKHEYFDFLVYPESAPIGWEKMLKESHAPFVISPLHEPDEEQSKPHYHVIYKHGGPVLLKSALGVLKPVLIDSGIAANGYIEITFHPRGYMRYLIHLDDPEKQQFDDGRESCTIINGFPLDMTRDLSQEQKRQIRRQILGKIEYLNMTEYNELIMGGYLNEDELDYACNHTIFFNALLSSRRYSITHDK